MWETPSMDMGPILDAGAVAALSADSGHPVLCDVRWYLDGRSGREAYEAVHLPAAVFVDLDEHLTAEPGPEVGRHPLPTAEAFAGSMGELGILYDDGPYLRDQGRWQQRYMMDLGLIIGGGTAQIQKNMIGERALGLPKEPKFEKPLN